MGCFEPGGAARELLRYAGAEPLELAPGDRVLVPVKREVQSSADGSLTEAVFPVTPNCIYRILARGDSVSLASWGEGGGLRRAGEAFAGRRRLRSPSLWTAPEERRATWDAETLANFEASITDEALEDDDLVKEAHAARMDQIAQRKEGKQEAAKAALEASLRVAGWLCPTCDEWNLSFRDVCYKCCTKRSAAGVVSRGVPDPRRHSGAPEESDSDDSAALSEVQEHHEDLDSIKPLLRKSSKRGGKKPAPPAFAHVKGKFGSKKGGGSKGGRKGQYGPVRLDPASMRPVRCTVFEPCGLGAYAWAVTRRVHITASPTSPPGTSARGRAWRRRFAAPVLLGVQVGVVEETFAAVAQQSVGLVEGLGAEAQRTVQVAGTAASIMVLMLSAAATWFVARNLE